MKKRYLIIAATCILIVFIFILVKHHEVAAIDIHNLGDDYNYQLSTAVKEGGVDRALQLFSAFYHNRPAFAAQCHLYSHNIGRAAYSEFRAGKKFSLTPETGYCGYGFYHGFIAALTEATSNLQEAKAFCDFVKSSAHDPTNDRLGQSLYNECYHGIGHGVTNAEDILIQGISEQSTINDSLALCKNVNDGFTELYNCATGVFGGVMDYFRIYPEKYTSKSEGVLWICESQADAYKGPCFDSVGNLLYATVGNDFSKALDIINHIPAENYKLSVLKETSANVAKANPLKEDFSDQITLCQSLPEAYIPNCLRGMIHGIMIAGVPKEQVQKTLTACTNPILRKDLLRTCVDQILSEPSNSCSEVLKIPWVKEIMGENKQCS